MKRIKITGIDLCILTKMPPSLDTLLPVLNSLDGIVEAYPFLLQSDLYQVAAGGGQNLDLSFNYFVSILSPLRISVDITGSPDHMKFDLVKSRFRDLLLPGKV